MISYIFHARGLNCADNFQPNESDSLILYSKTDATASSLYSLEYCIQIRF
jgi:hypothetical protein